MKALKVRGHSSWLSAVALSAGVLGLCGAGFGQVTGTVNLDGKAPQRKPVPGMSAVPGCADQHKTPVLDETVVADEDGNLQNVVVWLTGDAIKPEVPAEPAVLDQKGCLYTPHVVGMMVGQKLVAKNDDPFLHNVHTLPDNSEPQNLAQVNKGEDTLKPIKAEEFFPVKCDVHPWMKAWVAALPNQYFAVTKADGTYSIDTKGLADGTYEVHAWQEKYKDFKPAGKVTVKGGKGEANLTFKAAKAKADGVKILEQGHETMLASLTTSTKTGAACPTCPECDGAKAAKPAVAAAK